MDGGMVMRMAPLRDCLYDLRIRCCGSHFTVVSASADASVSMFTVGMEWN